MATMTQTNSRGTTGCMGSLLLELKKQESLLQMMKERGFTLCQQNGQRTYGGPPPNWGARPPPSRDCEVFIGRLPRMCFEDELIPLFLKVGELYEFRLMLDFSGTNRGYGYAHYATLAGANNAIKWLNKYEIRPGHQIGVLKSKNNCRLLFGNIRQNVSYESFDQFIRSATENVLNVIMFTTFNQLKMTAFNISLEVEEAFLARVPRGDANSQFAIVEYENHKAAAVARRVLIPRYGHILAIDWAVPPKERKRNCHGDYEELNGPARPVQNPRFDRRTFQPRNSTKPRPVPVLMYEDSVFDRVNFMPNSFHTVANYFKYLLKFSIFSSADRLEMPLQICSEIQGKIIDRITNLENCGQAVQLIFNYLAWYNEKKPFAANSELQKVLQEVKLYSDAFVRYVNNRVRHGPAPNPALDEYYCNILPLQLNVIFRIAVASTGDDKAKLSGRISTSLQWLNGLSQKCKAGNATAKDYLARLSPLFVELEEPALKNASSRLGTKNLITRFITPQQQRRTIVSSPSIDDESIGSSSHTSDILPAGDAQMPWVKAESSSSEEIGDRQGYDPFSSWHSVLEDLELKK